MYGNPQRAEFVSKGVKQPEDTICHHCYHSYDQSSGIPYWPAQGIRGSCCVHVSARPIPWKKAVTFPYCGWLKKRHQLMEHVPRQFPSFTVFHSYLIVLIVTNWCRISEAEIFALRPHAVILEWFRKFRCQGCMVYACYLHGTIFIQFPVVPVPPGAELP